MAKTLTDIASSAGVSPSTVSRYLRGQLNVQPVIAKRIESAIEKSGYQSTRRKNTPSTVALVIPELQNPYFAALGDALNWQATACGLMLTMLVSGNSSAREGSLIAKLSADSDIFGLIYAGVEPRNEALTHFSSQRLPLVVVDEDVDLNSEKASTVTVDNHGGSYQATSYLISLGHTRIAHVGGPIGSSAADERFAGYRDAMHDHGLKIINDHVIRGAYSEKLGANIFARLMRSRPFPSAIFSASDIVAIGILGAAERHGIDIPGDLSLVGCDGIYTGEWLRPRLTTVAQPISDIARVAMSMLQKLQTGQPVSQEKLPMELIIRSSAIPY